MSESTSKSWYLVYTKPRQEEVARVQLERQNYTVYLPRARQARRRQGRRVMTIEPLFPRYLFIHLDSQIDNWAPIRSTLGVACLVRFGQLPALIPSSLVRFLKDREGVAGLHEWAEPDYHEGDRVQVVEGAFQGYTGILMARTSRERVVVLLELLGRPVPTQVAISQIEHSRSS